MSKILGESKFIVIDSECFLPSPSAEDEYLRNELMAQFYLDAQQHGYCIFIIYDDYNPTDIKGTWNGAYEYAHEAIIQAVNNYNEQGNNAALCPQSMIERLYPYSAYQLLQEDRIQVETAESQYYPPDTEPLDHLAMLISPEEVNSHHSFLFGDVDLYIEAHEIDGFDAFSTIMTTYKEDIKQWERHKAQAKSAAVEWLSTITNATPKI